MKRVPVLTSGLSLPKIDRLRRPTHGGDWAELIVVEADDDEASLAGEYWSAGFARFLADGEIEHLDPFRGQRIGGHLLLTDPGLIEDFEEDYGAVDFREYYRS
jgi:hypothetical protein